ncbi:glycosyltransferase family 4 protein [Larkinella soli]|uniref:glycosyltransferase family 4 protein n=1 Tax=Larkinella soli TaxID=1770527 RepID=UPI000FFB49B4|nr:glycosyltransferase [Larkinella soli]
MYNRPLNLLWVAPFPYPKGDGHPGPWLQTLSDALAESGAVRLTVVSCHSGLQSDMEEFERNGIRFIYLKSPRGSVETLSLYSIRIRRLSAYLAKHARKYDLIHVHGTEHQYHSSLTGIDVPVITSIQGVINLYLDALPKGVKYGFSSKIVAAKHFVDWKIAAYYEAAEVKRFRNYICRTIFDNGYINEQVPDARIFNIWEMIRTQFFNLTLEKPGRKILFVGGSQPLKGLREALIALNELQNHRPTVMSVLGFVDPDCVRRIVRDYRLSKITDEVLEIKGFQTAEGIAQSMRESFCLLHPSYIDNSPNSICEAQVAGLPVVASAVGGVPTLIEDGKTGLLSPLEGHPLAQRLRMLQEDHSLWHRISAESSRMARQRHDKQTILNQTFQAYQSIS